MKSLCVSIETAKELKAAGWMKPTELSWYTDGTRIRIRPSGLSGIQTLVEDENPAPTAEEILRELPKDLEDKAMLVRYFPNAWRVSFGLGEGTLVDFGEYTLSEAAAQMWLWCKKEGRQ